MGVKNTRERVTEADLEEVNSELRKAIGDTSENDDDGVADTKLGVIDRMVKALDRSIDYLGKAATGENAIKQVKQDKGHEVSDGSSNSDPTTGKTTKRTEQAEDESDASKTGSKNRYGKNASRYPNRNKINKAEEADAEGSVESAVSEDGSENFELVEDSAGNVFAQDQEGNLFEVEEEVAAAGEAVAKGGAGERFLDRVDEDGEFVEVAEGSPALAHLTKCLADTLNELEAGLHGHLMEMEESNQLVLNTLQTHSKVFKAMLVGDEIKKSLPIHSGKGIRSVVMAGRKEVKTIDDVAGDKADRREALRKAVQDGKLEGRFLGLYAAAEARGVNGLCVIPDTILKSLDLEDSISAEDIGKAQELGIM